MSSNTPSVTCLIQKQLFKGSQRFEITDDDQLVFISKGAGNERSFKFSLLEIDPRCGRVKQTPWITLIGAILFGGFLTLASLGFLLHAPNMKSDDLAGIAVTFSIFGALTVFFFRSYRRNAVNVVAFYSRANGQPLVLLWHGNPSRQVCDDFVRELEMRINAAVARAVESQPREGIAGEIRALKKLVTDGLLSEVEFEKAKQKLLEEPHIKEPLGFSPEKT